MQILSEHMKKCPKAKLVEVIQDTPHGGELITTYKCSFCKEELVKRRSVDAEERMHPGMKTSVINLNLAHGIFCSSTNVQKGLEFFAEAGIRCPSASVMQELVSRMKNSVFDLSEEDLEINRKEHVLISSIYFDPFSILASKSPKHFDRVPAISICFDTRSKSPK
jgi:hypothetical protein